MRTHIYEDTYIVVGHIYSSMRTHHKGEDHIYRSIAGRCARRACRRARDLLEKCAYS
eukprot:17435_4